MSGGPAPPRMHVSLASKYPTRKSIMIGPVRKKPPQNTACSCIRPVMQQASSARTGRVGCSARRCCRCATLSCMPLHRPAPAPALHHRGVGPGPPKARFLGLRPTEGERARAKVHLFKRSSRRFLPFFDSADLCQLKSSLAAGKTAWPVVQLEVKWSQFSWARKRVKSVLGGQPVDNQK